MKVILLFSIGLILGMILCFLFELVLKTNKKLRNRYYVHHAIHFGYHIHHSTYGLLFFAISIILFLMSQKTLALAFVAFGLGIIAMHTISDPGRRIIFIEKQKT